MKLSVIVAPYDSGHYRTGIGLGPDAILEAGLLEALENIGHDVRAFDIGEVGDAQS